MGFEGMDVARNEEDSGIGGILICNLPHYVNKIFIFLILNVIGYQKC